MMESKTVIHHYTSVILNSLCCLVQNTQSKPGNYALYIRISSYIDFLNAGETYTHPSEK